MRLTALFLALALGGDMSFGARFGRGFGAPKSREAVMANRGTVPAVKPDHDAVEAARREVRSSLVAKYAKYVMKNFGRVDPPPFDVAACITNSQANAFQGTSYATGRLTTEQIRQRLAEAFRRDFKRLKVQ